MLLWTLQAKWNNKINSLLPFGDTLQTPAWSLKRPPPSADAERCLLSADSAKAVMASGRWGTRNPHLPEHMGNSLRGSHRASRLTQRAGGAVCFCRQTPETKPHLHLTDFLNLLHPSAEAYLDSPLEILDVFTPNSEREKGLQRIEMCKVIHNQAKIL